MGEYLRFNGSIIQLIAGSIATTVTILVFVFTSFDTSAHTNEKFQALEKSQDIVNSNNERNIKEIKDTLVRIEDALNRRIRR